MTEPLILTMLRGKSAEIERQIEALSTRLTDARADLIHVAATIRLFDPQVSDEKPITAYHGVNKAVGRAELFKLCKGALEASHEPLSTRELATHVVKTQGWDAEDRRLYLAVAARIGSMLTRFEKRDIVKIVGQRDRASVWRMT